MISSKTNPKIKQLRALRQRKEREATGLFVVEGIAPVVAALEAEALIEYVVYAPELLTSPLARDLISQHSVRGLPCHELTPDVFEMLSDKENPVGLLAVVKRPQLTLENLTPENFKLGVALVAPQDPGNIGTILRTLDGVHGDGLILLEGGTDAYHPQAVRASMGALFSQRVVSASISDFAHWIKMHTYQLIGTSAKATASYRDATYTTPLILLMGNEQKGLSPEHLALCQRTVRLPMLGKISSLNLAVATSVLLYEVLQQTSQAQP
jgi:TrmH family RNA methyltransferase